MSTLARTSRFGAFVVAAVVLAACGNDSSAPVPPPSATLDVLVPAGDWYEGDVTTLRAVVRDARGVELPGAPIAWSVSHPTRAEIAPNGVTTFVSPGPVTITAKSGTLSASRMIDVRRLSVLSVTILPTPLAFAPGDVAVLGIRVRGEGGRDVTGRPVTLSSDDPSVAVIDASGRLRAVSVGTTTIRASAEGTEGTARVDVAGGQATLSLSRVDDGRLPLLVAGDTVSWNGAREYHEVLVEGGELRLSGGTTPRYAIDIRYAEYHVTGPAGGRTYTLRATWRERDFGVVQYDARGDLLMTSEFISPLHHTAEAVSGGVRVRFRVPGEDSYLNLLYRRD